MFRNKVEIAGNLGANPELRFTANGKPCCNLSIATNRRYTDKEGKQQTDTQWHRVVVWGKQAETCSQYLAKGRQVLVEGRLQTRTWVDKDGNKHTIVEIVANNVNFLDKGKAPESEENTSKQVDSRNMQF